jgi:hypothetical protein
MEIIVLDVEFAVNPATAQSNKVFKDGNFK